MKARSCINKGRQFQRKIAGLILVHAQKKNPALTDLDIHPAIGAQAGSDIVFSTAGLEAFPYYVECKKTKTFRIYAAYDQAVKGLERSKRGGRIPVAIGSEDNKTSLALRWCICPPLLAEEENLIAIPYEKGEMAAWQLYEDLKHLSKRTMHYEPETGLVLTSLDIFFEVGI